MKLFWKLFCSMVLIASLTCALGGYLLIDSQFRATLDREVSALYEENDLLRYMLGRELEAYPPFTAADLQEGLAGLAEGGQLAFRLSDSDGIALISRGGPPSLDDGLAGKLPKGHRGWMLTRTGEGRTFLHAASPLVLADKVVYLENFREISSSFTARTEQYHSFSCLMLLLLTAVGLLSLAVSRLILRPLGRLSAAAKRMAGGELDVRVRVDSRDELGELSREFNAMAERLERQVQELKDAARRQEDFMGSFAHEIKTPLTSIIGYADLLRSRPATEEQLRESAGYIFSEGRRLEAMGRKLMDMLILERRDFPLRPVPMDAFLCRAAGAFRPALERQGISLEVHVEAAVMPLEPDLMETVVLNLLDNARKAMEQEGRLRLEGLCEPDGYRIRVSDNGKGIPEEELERITEPFYMVDKSRARAQGGAGLGLALCRRVVELHGGRLEFQSQVGRGTIASVYLKGEEKRCNS